MKSIVRNSALMALALAATVATTTAANASTNIAINPGSSSYEINATNLSTVPEGGWVNGSGYNFVFSTAGTAVSGTNSGLIMDGATSGTDFIALDADYQQGAVTNGSIGSLVAGDVVTLTFNFAASQQLTGSNGCGSPSCTGNFDAELAVTLGGLTPTANAVLDAADSSQAISANILTTEGTSSTPGTCAYTNGGNWNAGEKVPDCVKNQSWTGWESESLTFDVTAANSGVLSFLASDPNAAGQDPAFALIDDVTYSVTPPSPTPEPSSLLLLGTGLAGLSGLLRSRFKKSASAVV